MNNNPSLASLELLIENESELIQLGASIARSSGNSAIIYLEGELGAGKTTLCRGILRQLGYKGAIKSPTYTIVEPYTINQKTIFHFDLYRLTDPEEIEYIGGRDYFSQNALFLIEWSSRAEGMLPIADVIINLEIKLNQRKVTISAFSSNGIAIVKKIKRDT